MTTHTGSFLWPEPHLLINENKFLYDQFPTLDSLDFSYCIGILEYFTPINIKNLNTIATILSLSLQASNDLKLKGELSIGIMGTVKRAMYSYIETTQ